MTILPIKRVQEKRRERKKHKGEEQDWIRKEKEDQRPQWLEKRDKSKCHHCGQLGHNKWKCRDRAPPRRLQQQPVYNFHGSGKLFINKNKPYFADDIVSFLFHEKWPGYKEFTCQVNDTPQHVWQHSDDFITVPSHSLDNVSFETLFCSFVL